MILRGNRRDCLVTDALFSLLLMNITIVGSGYVGLVTGACFADVGHHVICIDNDQRKIAALQSGRIPIYEPGLQEIVQRNVSSHRLRFTRDIKTGEKVADTIRRYNTIGADFDVVSNPEFLREGSAVADLMHPDRIIIGSNSDRAVALMKKVYEPFTAPILVTDVKSAELIKHAANSFLALTETTVSTSSRVLTQRRFHFYPNDFMEQEIL